MSGELHAALLAEPVLREWIETSIGFANGEPSAATVNMSLSKLVGAIGCPVG
jgi:hypothetical protein